MRRVRLFRLVLMTFKDSVIPLGLLVDGEAMAMGGCRCGFECSLGYICTLLLKLIYDLVDFRLGVDKIMLSSISCDLKRRETT